MKIYFAGISGNKKRLDYLKDFGATRLMLTYADVKSYNCQMPRFKEKKFDILFDSGAFSLFNRGIKIDIYDYCEYLKINKLEKYIVLDKIGNHSETMQNQKIMEDYGMKPIPVFHMGSPLENLHEIIEKDYEYICLGGSVGASRNKRIDFFEVVFCNFPNHKFHGLGLSDFKIMKMFPFHSVDSTTWLIAEKVGKIFNDFGVRVTPPETMVAKDRFQNTIGFFVRIEEL